jgi:hypothetical protein
MAAGIAKAQTSLANAQSKTLAVEARLDALVNAVGVLVTELSGVISNASFLASISRIENQTTSNATISTTAGTFSNSERIAFNGLVNAVNNLQTHLQNHNIEA